MRRTENNQLSGVGRSLSFNVNFGGDEMTHFRSSRKTCIE